MKPEGEFEGVVRDVTSAGQGVVAHPSGRTAFVPGVWPGEEGRFRVVGSKGRVMFARVVELTVWSPHRRPAPCPHHGHSHKECGGCPWQFVAYPAQLDAKQQRIAQSLERFELGSTLRNIWPSDDEFAYRNRAQFKSDGQRLGYVAANSQQLIDIKACSILNLSNQAHLARLRAQLPNPQWRPQRRQPWVTLDVDDLLPDGEVSVNERLPFRQANASQNARMKRWLAEHLASLPERQKALELFCGSGNFTEVLLDSGVSDVAAVEGVDAALVALMKALPDPRVRTLCVDLFDAEAFARLIRAERDADILLLDPPREGLKQKAGLFDKKARFKHVFYISCDLATFCRDLQAFVEAGYQVQEIQPLDQFPQTPHVELMARLDRI